MKRLFLTLLAVLALASCQQGAYDTEKIKDAVRGQMETWPQSRLQDLYKSFFQDRFGPGHIIQDRQSAKDYILSELAAADTIGGPAVYPCGWEGNYVRVSLSVLADGLLTADELTDALVASAKPIPEEALGLWKEEWKVILGIIEQQYPDIPDMQADKERIDSLLASGEYAYHHSDAFNAAYAPHYRIIDKNLAKGMLNNGYE